MSPKKLSTGFIAISPQRGLTGLGGVAGFWGFLTFFGFCQGSGVAAFWRARRALRLAGGRAKLRPMPRDGAQTLSDLDARGEAFFVVNCARCQRRGVYGLRAAMARWGAGAKMPDLLYELTADCRRERLGGPYDRCVAVFETRGSQ